MLFIHIYIYIHIYTHVYVIIYDWFMGTPTGSHVFFLRDEIWKLPGFP